MRILISVLLLVPAAAFASSSFDGTWKGRVDSMKVTGKPDAFVVADGMYNCSSCVPEVKIKADGTDQKVTGHDYYDTIAVKIVDAKTIEITNKRAGKTVDTTTYTVSADGKTLSGKFADYNGAKPATGSFAEKRVGAAPAGAHATSGSWLQNALSDANDAATIVSYEMTKEHFAMHANGQRYDAKFDGKEYPIEGDPGHTVVTLKMVDENTVIETDRRGGKITDEIRLAAAKDGKTMTLTDKDVIHGQTTTFTLDRQ